MISIAKVITGLAAVMTIIAQPVYGQRSPSVSVDDFGKLVGHWQGKLTYLDYQSNQPYTMQAVLDVVRIGAGSQFEFRNSYPKEPGANSTDTVTISNDGKLLDNEKVTGRRLLKDGSLEIVTEVLGKDGNDDKPAVIRHTYTLGSTSYLVIKEVQFAGEKNWIKRHEYSYAK